MCKLKLLLGTESEEQCIFSLLSLGQISAGDGPQTSPFAWPMVTSPKHLTHTDLALFGNVSAITKVSAAKVALPHGLSMAPGISLFALLRRAEV